VNGKKERTMKKFLTFVTVAGIMILASGCEIHTRTVYVPKKGSTTVVQATPAPPATVVVYEEDPYNDPYETAHYSLEPDYLSYCDWWGNEECCYDYDVQEVWLNPYEYIYEVCEYTSCVDYDFGILTEDSVNCWYE
tara:strand:- start:25 stop:432 length:408 start_codon:yes stop_codon:yes gene_type:complete